MKTSESIANLSQALSKAQAEIPALEKTAKNPFLKNKYIPLDDILTIATPILTNNDLAIIQLPYSDGGVIVGVTTRLAHKSGEWVEDTISLQLTDEKGKSAAQVAGSVITYLRRYSLSSLLGIASETDTDGNAAPKQAQKPAKSAAPAKKNAAPVNIVDWMVEEDHATNIHNARSIFKNLKLAPLMNTGDVEAAQARVIRYRELRDEGMDAEFATVHAIKGGE